MNVEYRVHFFTPESTSFDVIPQVKIVDKFNEELDMCEFTLATIDHKLDFDFKKYNGLIPIFLKMNGTIIRIAYLSYYNCLITSYDPMKYKYIIQAVSPTIELQRIVLPNKLITQKIVGTKRTILEELTKILDVYAPFITGIAPEVQEKLNIACPEMQFVKSTLHEVLIGLFAVAGLIPRMASGNVLDCINLKGNESPFTFRNFIRVEESNSLANYTDALDYDIENAISKDEDITTTWIAPTSDEAVVTTDNYFWQMPSDIYEIIDVVLSGENIEFKTTVEGEWFPLKGEKIDITNYVVSKEVYDTLKVSSKVIQTGNEYKRNNLYYDEDRIDGATFVESSWLPGTFKEALVNVVLNALNDSLPSGAAAVKINDSRKTLMKVRYKTLAENSRVKIIKKGIEKPINFLISNQDESYIDIVNFGESKQSLINRLGNTEILAQGKFTLENGNLYNIPQVGDIIEDNYIITEREMELKESTAIANFTLTKDYTFTSGYSGLKQLKRFTQIDTKRTLIRNDNFLFNFQLCLENKTNANAYLINQILSKYAYFTTKGITQHYVRTQFENGKESDILIMASQNKAIADSIICKIGFNHNYIAGDSVDLDGDKFLKKPIKYTDENGEFKTIKVYFGEAEERKDDVFFPGVAGYPSTIFYDASKDYKFNQFLINKDNREITNITMQFRMVSNEKDNIFIYNAFSKLTGLTAHDSSNLKVYFSYNKGTFEDLGELYNDNTVTPIGEQTLAAKVVFKDNTIIIKNTLTDFGSYTVGVTDNHNNLLFGVNYNFYTTTHGYDLVLYLNDL